MRARAPAAAGDAAGGAVRRGGGGGRRAAGDGAAHPQAHARVAHRRHRPLQRRRRAEERTHAERRLRRDPHLLQRHPTPGFHQPRRRLAPAHRRYANETRETSERERTR